jgi:hypothetical protein
LLWDIRVGITGRVQVSELTAKSGRLVFAVPQLRTLRLPVYQANSMGILGTRILLDPGRSGGYLPVPTVARNCCWRSPDRFGDDALVKSKQRLGVLRNEASGPERKVRGRDSACGTDALHSQCGKPQAGEAGDILPTSDRRGLRNLKQPAPVHRADDLGTCTEIAQALGIG